MLKNIYNQRITIINKLRRDDVPGATSSTKDVWTKFVVENAVWYEKSARNSGGNGVFIGTYITVLIPFNDNYMEYRFWKDLEDKSNNFTLSSGDYIVLGDVPEEITASNVVEVMKGYANNSCQVKHIERPHKRFGATVQLKVEGV